MWELREDAPHGLVRPCGWLRRCMGRTRDQDRPPRARGRQGSRSRGARERYGQHCRIVYELLTERAQGQAIINARAVYARRVVKPDAPRFLIVGKSVLFATLCKLKGQGSRPRPLDA